jgi:crotonobetainyl-CoA:carnitine CoA-transferase CaiB-like acyl-CoA transferase
MTSTTSQSALEQIWQTSGIGPAALDQIDLPEQAQIFPSSFATGTAAQASIGAAALAAETLYFARNGQHQTIEVTKPAAERECTGFFTYNGEVPNAWEKFSGLYETNDGHVRIHANFEHHRDGVLALLNLPAANQVEREDVSAALLQWSAESFESAAAAKGLVVSMVRTFDEWDQHPHAIATRALPLLSIRQIGAAEPRPLSPSTLTQRPLEGVRVLDLTRILAGPICGRTLAAYGADVMLINSPELPNISSIIDTSRGKRSVHLDLQQADQVNVLLQLLDDSHIFVQGYRPQALAGLGLTPEQLAERRPGIVYVSLSAYSNTGPWSPRRGFDSLVQTATGFNHAEAIAAGTNTPKTLPQPILDYVSGYLMAYGAQVALHRQIHQGGSWHVEVSLLQTAAWLRSLGRLEQGFEVDRPNIKQHLETFACDHGALTAIPHAAEFSTTPACWQRPSAMPGSHEPLW